MHRDRSSHECESTEFGFYCATPDVNGYGISPFGSVPVAFGSPSPRFGSALVGGSRLREGTLFRWTRVGREKKGMLEVLCLWYYESICS